MSRSVSAGDFSKRGLAAIIIAEELRESFGVVPVNESTARPIIQLAQDLCKRSGFSRAELLARVKELKSPNQGWGGYSVFLEDSIKQELGE